MSEILKGLVSLRFLLYAKLCITFIGIALAIYLRGYFGADPIHAESMKQRGMQSNAYAKWQNGPPSDPGYFPIAVWLQNPAKCYFEVQDLPPSAMAEGRNITVNNGRFEDNFTAYDVHLYRIR